MICSPHREEKQNSLEIRIIPNSYFLYTPSKKIHQFIQDIVSITEKRQECSLEELKKTMQEIFFLYTEIFSLFLRLNGNTYSTDSFNKLIQDFLKTIEVNESLLDVHNNFITPTELQDRFVNKEPDEDEYEDDYNDDNDDYDDDFSDLDDNDEN